MVFPKQAKLLLRQWKQDIETNELKKTTAEAFEKRDSYTPTLP